MGQPVLELEFASGAVWQFDSGHVCTLDWFHQDTLSLRYAFIHTSKKLYCRLDFFSVFQNVVSNWSPEPEVAP
jgi:hypothetical protein